MVTFLAGNRIRGTNAERGTSGIGTLTGGWVELGRTTLGSESDTISVGSLADKRYYMILCNASDIGGTISLNPRLNGDAGSNYASRQSQNGATDTTAVSQTEGRWADTSASDHFGVGYIANLSAKEKLVMTWSNQQNATGAGTAPNRFEGVTKHAQTTNPISTIATQNGGAGSYDTNSELVILGWDPTDTHTDNFWEELDSSNGDGTGGWTSGTFTAKKYLWIQAWLDPSAVTRLDMRFNGDSGSNYSRRFSENGGADGTAINQTAILDVVQADSVPSFVNMFIINNVSNEKLAISHTMHIDGTGAGEFPRRMEGIYKWVNTVDQITSIDMIPEVGNYSTSSILKVWGAN